MVHDSERYYGLVPVVVPMMYLPLACMNYKITPKHSHVHSTVKPKIMEQRYLKYSVKSMESALRELREVHMSCKAAAKAFGVPRTTLRDKLAGRSPEERQMGPNSVLPKLRRLLW